MIKEELEKMLLPFDGEIKILVEYHDKELFWVKEAQYRQTADGEGVVVLNILDDSKHVLREDDDEVDEALNDYRQNGKYVIMPPVASIRAALTLLKENSECAHGWVILGLLQQIRILENNLEAIIKKMVHSPKHALRERQP